LKYIVQFKDGFLKYLHGRVNPSHAGFLFVRVLIPFSVYTKRISPAGKQGY
jgi:hypothetical protein